MKIITSNNNNYIYLNDLLEFTYLPSNKKMCKKKEDYILKNKLCQDCKPNLTEEYDEYRIKANLANLRMILIEVTESCNLSCKYCAYRELYDNYDHRNNKHQEMSNVKSLINYLKELWDSPLNTSYNNNVTFGFYGGEPLLAFPIIEETVSYLNSLKQINIKFSFNMTTNGVLLDKYYKFLVDNKFNLLISLDGNEKNNEYRTFINNGSSFEKIVANTLKIKEEHPEYFDAYVNFNAVLHNKNSVEDIYSYIKQQFNKIPIIAELNGNGIDEKKKELFYELYQNKRESIDKVMDCVELKEDLLFTNPNITALNFFIEAYLSNTYKSYTDLFINRRTQRFIPTGSCMPFHRKLFLTVNGKILPCERVGQRVPLGMIDNGKICIKFDKIKEIYSKMYSKIIKQCENCILWKNCTLCVFFIKEKNGELVCPHFLSKKDGAFYFTGKMSFVENERWIYSKIINEMKLY